MNPSIAYKPLAPSRFFSDGTSARQLVEGTVPFQPGGHAISPMADMSMATTLPFALTPQLMDRGQGRFNIYCSPCHGRLGYGNGMVVQRGFTPPPSFHIDRLRGEADGYFFNAITNGFGVMPNYAQQVPVLDRWAITQYIRALQLSQHASLDDVPEAQRATLGSDTESR